MLSPVPEFIAAVIPMTRSSRRASATSASPNTCVYAGGAGFPPAGLATRGGAPLGGDLGVAAGGFSPPPGGGDPLPFARRTGATEGTPGGRALAQRPPERPDVVAVDDAHVGE